MNTNRTAPELPDMAWANTSTPPTLEANRGRVVLMAFWTYSNINSQHVMAHMRELQTKYENSIAVIGIHCPRFSQEQDAANVLKAVNRWHIRAPVAVDSGFACWQRYGVNAWPSVLVLDTQGRVRHLFEGDRQGDTLENLVDQLLSEAAMDEFQPPGRTQPPRMPEAKTTMSFPSGVAAAKGAVFVSDSGNNRVLELAPDGRVLRVFGSGNVGLWDGFLDNCGFNSPSGLIYYDQHLYVADTGNHAIRRINLMTGEVETLAGNGKVGREPVKNYTDLRQIPLASPTGLALKGAELFIAMTGMNQIWKLQLDMGAISWLAGCGQAMVADGPAERAAFAGPRGVAVSGNYLLVTDADGSAIRQIDRRSGQVQTLIGADGEYSYGNHDGDRRHARLQYPTGIAVEPGLDEAWIIDSFNGQLRHLDLASGELQTPDFLTMNEPVAIALDNAAAWIVNTNEHSLIKLDLHARRGEEVNVRTTRV